MGLVQKPSAIFGYLQIIFGNFHLAYERLLQNLRKFSEVVGNVWKITKHTIMYFNSLYKNWKITWSLEDTKFLFSC